ncbi:MAG: cytochrome c, partial [Dokdonella sp.]
MATRLAGICALVLLLSGCEKAMQNMYNQPKYKPLAASTLWRDGQSARPDEPGTVAHSAGAIA